MSCDISAFDGDLAMQPVDFWIEFGSTYTYLSVARIGKFAAAQGVEVRWQPFFLMPIMAELGMTEGPFLPFPSKARYICLAGHRAPGTAA